MTSGQLVLEYTTKFLAYYGLVVIFFYAMSLVIPKAAFVARGLAAYIALIFGTILGVVSCILFALIGKRYIAEWITARFFWYGVRMTTGVDFIVDDPKDILNTVRPAVFVGNHQTELDIAMLGRIFPKHCSVTAKASLKNAPFLGWFMRLSGAIFLDRANAKGARLTLDNAAKQIRDKKQSVFIFPEGTRSYTKEPTLLPFKKGGFHLAVQSGAPIVPCVCANYSYVLFIKNWVFNGGKIPVKILDPIPTENLTAADVNDLCASTQELMLKELIILSAKARGKTVEGTSATDEKPTATSTAVETSS